MDGEQNDFVVETTGHCFLCLGRKPTSNKSVESVIDLPSLNSLRCVSRYIKLDMRKVFCSDDLESIPHHLLEKVQRSNLKVELCGKCVPINDRFSRLYRQLENIEMEMTSCLKLILAQLEDTPKFEMTPRTLALDKGKLEVVEALRKDVFEKGAHKISKSMSSPRIKIKRLTKKEVTASSKPKRKFSPRKSKMDMDEEGYQPRNVKLEDVPEDFVMDDDNDNSFLDQHEDCNWYSDDEEYADPAEGTEKNERFSNEPLKKKNQGGEDVPSTTNAQTVSVNFASATSHRAVTSEPAWTTNSKTGKRKCKICSKEFSGEGSGFRAHYRSVHLQAKYKCNLCGKEFTSPNGYKSHHQAVHLGVRFKCLVCAKCFFDRSTLRKHQRICGGGDLPI